MWYLLIQSWIFIFTKKINYPIYYIQSMKGITGNHNFLKQYTHTHILHINTCKFDGIMTHRVIVVFPRAIDRLIKPSAKHGKPFFELLGPNIYLMTFNEKLVLF